MTVTAPGEHQGRRIPFRPHYEVTCVVAGYMPHGAVVQLEMPVGWIEAGVAPALDLQINLNEHIGRACLATVAPSYVRANSLPECPMYEERRRRARRMMYGDSPPPKCITAIRLLDDLPTPISVDRALC